MNENKNSKKLTMGLFVIYFLILTWIILFKMETDLSLLQNMNFRSINLIPFSASLEINGKIDVSEIILNIIAFIPFGMYFSMMNSRWKFMQKTLLFFGVSLFYEIMQYILAIGGSDITDLITNTLGGVTGLGIYFLCSKLLGKNTIKVINILATVGTVCMVGVLGLLTVVTM